MDEESWLSGRGSDGTMRSMVGMSPGVTSSLKTTAGCCCPASPLPSGRPGSGVRGSGWPCCGVTSRGDGVLPAPVVSGCQLGVGTTEAPGSSMLPPSPLPPPDAGWPLSWPPPCGMSRCGVWERVVGKAGSCTAITSPLTGNDSTLLASKASISSSKTRGVGVGEAAV